MRAYVVDYPYRGICPVVEWPTLLYATRECSLTFQIYFAVVIFHVHKMKRNINGRVIQQSRGNVKDAVGCFRGGNATIKTLQYIRPSFADHPESCLNDGVKDAIDPSRITIDRREGKIEITFLLIAMALHG